MPLLRIKDLKSGMIVAKRIVDKNGRLILSAGEKISSKHIRTFKAWGITEVDVDDSGGSDFGTPSLKESAPSVPDKILKEVDELFRYTDKRHPVISELVELCIVRKMESP